MTNTVKIREHEHLTRVARRFAKAWAEWHNTSDMGLTQEVIEEAHNILGAIGLEMCEKNGKHSVRKIKQ